MEGLLQWLVKENLPRTDTTLNSFLIVYGYAAVVAIVGTLGYVLKKSVPSIAAGVVSAIILIIAGRAIQQGQSWGFPTALVVTVLLLLNFGSRYMRSETHDFWPNGLMAVVSLLALVAMVISSRGRALFCGG